MDSVDGSVPLAESACTPARKRTRIKPAAMQAGIRTTNKGRKGKKKTDKKQVRLLKKAQERSQIQDIDRERVVSHIHTTVSSSLVPGLFPERLVFWEMIRDTVELKNFIHSAIDKFISLFEQNSKGKEKYANLYLAWLDYIRTFMCRSKQTLATLATMALLRGNHALGTCISSATQRTVIAGILHAVQDGIQSQMATKIETLEAECSVTELPADDTALYRISGWAQKNF